MTYYCVLVLLNPQIDDKKHFVKYTGPEIGFLPVYKTREDAEKYWPNDTKADIIEIDLVEEEEKEDDEKT